MFLDGPLVLCTRLSNSTVSDRTLEGRLTQFGIFDQALNATQMETLYQQVGPNVPALMFNQTSGSGKV